MFTDLPLDRRLLLALNDMGLNEPTAVQSELIPLALDGGDVKVRAETGSGKTLAYLLPVAQRLLDGPIKRNSGTLALVLVPTRELARQVLKQCRALLQKTSLKASAITGGADFKYQKSIFRSNPEIIIATPGRLKEHCERGSADLSDLQALVFDEADRILDLGLRDDVLFIAEQSKNPQVMMLSATLKHKGLSSVSQRLLSAPRTLSLSSVRQAHQSIQHRRILADSQQHKDQLLVAVLGAGEYGRTLVFANKRSTANRLGALLRNHDIRADCLQGDMSTEKRKQVISRINNGKLDVLCASDVAARGLDLDDIGLVVNYDLPFSGDDYVHRSGRTGRAGATGVAISLVNAAEWNRMIGIERYLNMQLEAQSLPGLKAKYSGPRKTKSSGKAASAKKKTKKPSAKAKKKAPPARSAAGRGKKQSTGNNDGFAPLTRQKKS